MKNVPRYVCYLVMEFHDPDHVYDCEITIEEGGLLEIRQQESALTCLHYI